MECELHSPIVGARELIKLKATTIDSLLGSGPMNKKLLI